MRILESQLPGVRVLTSSSPLKLAGDRFGVLIHRRRLGQRHLLVYGQGDPGELRHSVLAAFDVIG